MIDPESAASWSRHYRKCAGLTQRQLAARIRTSPGVIGDLERGIVRSRRVAREIMDLMPDNVEGLV